MDEAKRILVSEKQPSGSLCTPEDIGNLATYLCTEAAKQMQGGTYTVDGAWTAQ
jgi:3-hydroxybutyrate dehydrogenase